MARYFIFRLSLFFVLITYTFSNFPGPYSPLGQSWALPQSPYGLYSPPTSEGVGGLQIPTEPSWHFPSDSRPWITPSPASQSPPHFNHHGSGESTTQTEVLATLDDPQVERLPTWMAQNFSNYELKAESKQQQPQPQQLQTTTTSPTLFGLFNIVRFSHFICEAADGLKGSCYTARECRRRGGSGSIPCAMGFGVCCIFNVTCGGDITNNGTYFLNPRFPLTFSGDGSCNVNVARAPASDNICQLRLDFEHFDVQRPERGDCNADRFVVSGQNSNNMVPPICGLNTGQHIYVDVDMAQGPINLNMLTSGSSNRLWAIRITQIPCNVNYKTPGNCLQYFTGVRGNFRSFNYDHISLPTDGEGYLNNLDYIICLRKEAGFCSVSYTNSGTARQFSIMNVNRAGIPLLLPDVSGSGMRDCPDDFLNLNGVPLCGDRLNGDSANHIVDAPVLDATPGQFMIRFRSNEAFTARGFNITYQQLPCGATVPFG